MSYKARVVQEFMPNGDEVWTASHPDLLGCHAVGRSSLEACRGLDEVRPEWLARAHQLGATIPPEREGLWIDLEFAPQGDQ